MKNSENNITYQKLLEENRKLQSELEEKDKRIRKLDDENLKLKDTENKRNKEFVKIRAEHAELLKELEQLRQPALGSSRVDKEGEGDLNEAEEKVSKLKKKVMQEK